MERRLLSPDFAMWIIGSAITVVIVIGIFYLIDRGTRPLMKKLAAELPGEYVFHLFLSSYVRALDQGQEFKIFLLPRTQMAPPILHLELNHAPGFRFLLERKDSGLAGQLRFSLAAVPFADPDLERQYRLRSNQPDRAREFFWSSPGRLDAADHFFGSGFWKIEARDLKIIAQKPNYLDNDLALDLIRGHLDQLAKLAG